MSDDLYIKAKQNVLQRKEEQLEKEIQKECRRLKYEAEKIPLDGKVEELYWESLKLRATGFAGNLGLHHNRRKLKEMREQGKYNPRELERIKYQLSVYK